MSSSDHYATLGVARDVDADAIRRAYRSLARKYHPDVNPDTPTAEARFKEVTGAYEVLSDAKKRALYDEFGDLGLREGFDAAQARAYGGRRGRAGGGGGGFDDLAGGGLGDLFADFFSSGRRGPTPGRGQDLVATVEIDLGQALRGASVQLQVPTPAPCSLCRGRGCGGCGGSGQVAQPQALTVRVPAGVDNGGRVRVAGRGTAGRLGGPPGDLIIETRVRPHPYFSRDGLDLELTLPISLSEAIDGASLEVPTPAGMVQLRVPPASQQGSRLRLRGRGVRRGERCGDLYVTLNVRLPDGEVAELAVAARLAATAYSKPLRADLTL